MFSESVKSLFKTTNLIYLLIALILLFSCIYAFQVYFAPQQKNNFKTNNEISNFQNNSNDKSVDLLLFYADWCPHCKTAKPEWNAIKDEYDGKTLHGYTLVFKDINCTDNNNAEVNRMTSQYGVEGYPTIKLIKDGQVIEFDAKPTRSSLKQFIQTVIVP
jgi:thiol-disulfide isomerase/thioredoxin